MGGTVRYGSVCSGIEAASVAWHELGWRPVFLSEIEAFPCAVLAHHYPDTPNLGDMTKFEEWPDADIDVLVGGTPCQSFSVAGLRKGLDDPRGNLMLTFGAIARRYRPEWLVWENVPGVLSSNGGRDFGTFLGMLGELGYGFAYRVLDAQYFGVAQRRRRVFVVGCLGNWRRAAAVLFERDSLQGSPAPSREARKVTAATIGTRTASGSLDVFDQIAAIACCDTAHTLRGEGFDASEDGAGRGNPIIPIDMRQASRGATMTNNRAEGSSGGAPGIGIGQDGDPSPTTSTSHTPAIGFGWQNSASQGDSVSATTSPTLDKSKTPAVAVALRGRDGGATAELGDEVGHALRASSGGGDKPYVLAPVAFDTTQITSAANYSNPKPGDPCHPIAAGAHAPAIATTMQVRRLTPIECARLQGFPDHYLDITYRGKPAADGPKYKALGNSMAVPVIRWIGERIQAVSEIKVAEAAR